ncbi:LysR family transcriptional regulator [Chitinimonas naiadis]
MQNMDWDDLKCFLAVQQGGSLSAAARKLAVNHSTVLRRLGHLEATLGVRLFERLATGYLITAAGEALVAELAGLSEQIEGAQRRLMGQDQAIRGPIRLTSTDTLFASLLTPLLAEFRALHPEVTLELVMNNSFLSLTRREADVAVRGTNQPPEHLLGRRVGRIQTAPYASHRYLAELGDGLPWADYQWVAPDEGLRHLEQARWLADNVPTGRIVARSDSLVGMLHCVRADMGAAMLLCPLGDAEPGLKRLGEPNPALDTEIWVLTHPDMRRVARVRALTDFLYVRLSQDAHLQHG